MTASLRWTGLDELKADLRRLPDDLAQGAGPIVTGAAEQAAQDMVYPERTGNLAKGLKVVVEATRYGASAKVINTSKIARIFELGTQARFYRGAARGSMPAGKVFLPAVIKRRREMYERLKTFVASHGLRVTGDA